MNPWKFLAAFVIGLSACTVHAVVVIADKYQPGDQGVLFDTETGLDWARGPTGLEGGPYEGFRLASPSEVGTLSFDVGLREPSGIYESYGPPPDYPPIVSSVKEAFDVLFYSWHPGSIGSYSPSTQAEFFQVAAPDLPADRRRFGQLGLSLPTTSGPPPAPIFYFVDPACCVASEGPPGFSTGRALVRVHVSAIPEPATFALMSLGLASMLHALRRKRSSTGLSPLGHAC